MRQVVRRIMCIVVGIVTLLVASLGLPPVQPVRAASIVVNDPADTTGGCAASGSGSCTLRDAITYANATPGADTITFSVSGTILLGAPLPNITGPAGLTIDGVGQRVTISGNHAVSVTFVAPSVSLTLRNLTIANCGGEYGGALDNRGTLIVDHTTFSGNTAMGFSNGGAIFNEGSATLTDSTFSGNSAGNGGAIYNAGSATLTGSTFSGNSAAITGGGIVTTGTLTVINSTFFGNTGGCGCGNGGGAIVSDSGAVALINSTLTANRAIGSGGGGIQNPGGTVTLVNTIVAATSLAPPLRPLPTTSRAASRPRTVTTT